MPLEEGSFNDVNEHIETAPNLIEDENDTDFETNDKPDISWDDLETNDEVASDKNIEPDINWDEHIKENYIYDGDILSDNK